MAVVMGPDGQLINTSNINSSVIGSSLIPNITPNIGALNTIDKPVRNDDGTITLPTIEMKSNDPGLESGQLQKLYGTDLMPYFNWVETYQTGTTTYDPADDNSAAELEAINEEFKAKHGISAQEAALQLKRMGQKTSGALAGRVGGAFAQSMIGSAGAEGAFGQASKDALGALNPFSGMMNKAPTNTMSFLVDGKAQNLTTAQAANLGQVANVKINPNQPQPQQSAMQAGLNTLKGTETGFSAIGDRLYGGSAANMANLKVTGAAAGVDFITQVAMGADPMDAAKDAGKTAVLSYVANAIIPGSGPIVGFLSKFF